MSLHRRYTELVRVAFDGSLDFVTAMDKGLQVVANHHSLSSGLLARYCDFILRKYSREAADVGKYLSNIVSICRA